MSVPAVVIPSRTIKNILQPLSSYVQNILTRDIKGNITNFTVGDDRLHDRSKSVVCTKVICMLWLLTVRYRIIPTFNFNFSIKSFNLNARLPPHVNLDVLPSIIAPAEDFLVLPLSKHNTSTMNVNIDGIRL